MRKKQGLLFALFLGVILLLAVMAGCAVGEGPPKVVVNDVRVVSFDSWGSVEVEKEGYRRWLFFGSGCSPYTIQRFYLVQPLYRGAVFDYVVHAPYPKCPIEVHVKTSVFQGEPKNQTQRE